MSTFLLLEAVLLHALEDAVVKLCRHVDEFASTNFGFDLLAPVADQNSEIRTIAREFEAKDPVRYERHEAFFPGYTTARVGRRRALRSVMNAMMRMGQPQEGHTSGSTS